MDSWNLHTLESVEESIGWFISFRKLPKSRATETVESTLTKHLQTCASILAFVIKQWKGFFS